MISGAHKLTAPVVSEIIEEARYAELCRDIAMMRDALAPVWPDIDKDPDYAGFGTIVEARLLRLSGFLLSFAGKCCGRPDYHPRAKDLISTAINLFGAEVSPDEETEANVILALAYWYAGEAEESRAVLEIIDRSFDGNPGSPLYLQIQLNRLLAFYYFGEHERSVNLIRSIDEAAVSGADLRLRTMFHNQAGIILDAVGLSIEALDELQTAQEYAEQLGNRRFFAMNLNNIALVCSHSHRYAEAEAAVEDALAIFTELGDRGWVPNVLDTKALIFLASGRVSCALEVVDESIGLFRQGGDNAGLCDAMWTRAKILLRLGRTEDALQQYGVLHTIASASIGPTATAKYTRLLVDELGLSASNTSISRLADLSVGGAGAPVELFFVPASAMSRFGIDEDCAVPVRTVRRPAAGMPVIYAAGGDLHLGRVVFDVWARMYCIPHDADFPSPLEQVPVIGECFGWCPIGEVGDGSVEFREFPPADVDLS